jgi:hypothetical protein
MGDLAHGERVPPLGELALLPEDLTRVDRAPPLGKLSREKFTPPPEE